MFFILLSQWFYYFMFASPCFYLSKCITHEKCPNDLLITSLKTTGKIATSTPPILNFRVGFRIVLRVKVRFPLFIQWKWRGRYLYRYLNHWVTKCPSKQISITENTGFYKIFVSVINNRTIEQMKEMMHSTHLWLCGIGHMVKDSTQYCQRKLTLSPLQILTNRMYEIL